MPSVTSGCSFDPPVTEVQAVTSAGLPVAAVAVNDEDMITPAVPVLNPNDTTARASHVRTPSHPVPTTVTPVTASTVVKSGS